MKAARLGTAALVLWAVTVLTAGVLYYRSSRAAHARVDTREAIELPAAARDAVLAEMRTMLQSVNGILTASASGDTAAMRAAAARVGTTSAADSALGQMLPAEFVGLGMSTHHQFDSLAAAIAAAAPRDTITAHLARITAGCTSCHVAYRLVAR